MIVRGALIALAWLAPAEPSSLERAYLKELTFLKAEKAEMEKRAREAERETERVLELARGDVEALKAKVGELRRQSDVAEEKLRDAPAASKEKLDAVYESVARADELVANSTGGSVVQLPVDRAPTDEEASNAVVASFTAVASHLSLGGKIRREKGTYFGAGGKQIEGEIVRIGNDVAAFGISPEGVAGALVPAGLGRFKLESPPQATKSHGLVDTLMGLPIFEAEWVLYLLIILSVLSAGFMVERGLFYRKHSVDIDAVRTRLKELLGQGDYSSAADYLAKFDSLETNVTLFGLREHQRGPDSVEDSLRGAEAREKLRYHRGLSFLATVGSNSPFIGLFGTVLGIIHAFSDLAADAGSAGSAGGTVMAGISEALIATAVGLLVAIPAVVAYNAFMGRVKTVLANSELLSRTLLSALKAQG